MDCVRAGRGGLKRHLFKCNIASNVSSLSSRLLQICTYFGVCSFRNRKFIQECVELFARFAFTQNNFGVVLFFSKSWRSKFIQECEELFAGFAFSQNNFLVVFFFLELVFRSTNMKPAPRSNYLPSFVNMQLLLFIVEICQLQETITITYLPQWSFGKHATFYCWDSWSRRWRWLWWILKNDDDENEYMCEPYEECVPLKKQCVYCIPYDNDGACTPPDTAQRQSPGWGKLMHTLSFWGKERQLQTINLKWAKG